jgi:choline transporter-like protein 2/4/5
MFINRNAYIIIGIKGSNYVCAACLAIKLIIKNALRLTAINIVGDLLLFLGKVSGHKGCTVNSIIFLDDANPSRNLGVLALRQLVISWVL